MLVLARREQVYQRVFDSEQRDEGWASSIEVKAHDLYATRASQGVRLTSASCRTTICRLEFHYDHADDRQGHLQTLGNEFSELPRIGYAYPGEPDAHDAAVAFLMRQGHELPPFNDDKQ
jgi:hypothetical protein